MSVNVKLKDLTDEMEMLLDESHSFLNSKTGTIVAVSSEDLRTAEDEEPFNHLPEWQQENIIIAIDVVENYDDYIKLPSKYDVNEYNIMEDFCFSITDQRKQDILLKAITGKGAFRRFKDNIIEFKIESDWYSYRHERVKQIAINWCKENNINYLE